MRGRLIGPKTWDRNIGISLRFFFIGRDCPEISGLFGCFKFIKFALNHVLIGKRPGMGRLIGPKTWDRIVGIFFRLLDSP